MPGMLGMGGDVGRPSNFQDSYTPPIGSPPRPRPTAGYERRPPQTEQAQALQALQQRARMMQMMQQLGMGQGGNQQQQGLQPGLGQFIGNNNPPSVGDQYSQIMQAAAQRPVATTPMPPGAAPTGAGGGGGGGGGFGGGGLTVQDLMGRGLPTNLRGMTQQDIERMRHLGTFR